MAGEDKVNMSERAELERLRAEAVLREERLKALEEKQLAELKPLDQIELDRRIAIKKFIDRGYLSGSEKRKPRSEAHAAFLMRAGEQAA